MAPSKTASTAFRLRAETSPWLKKEPDWCISRVSGAPLKMAFFWPTSPRSSFLAWQRPNWTSITWSLIAWQMSGTCTIGWPMPGLCQRPLRTVVLWRGWSSFVPMLTISSGWLCQLCRTWIINNFCISIQTHLLKVYIK